MRKSYSYVEAVANGMAEDEYTSWIFLGRAISLSMSLSDTGRISRAKDALFAYFRKLAAGESKFMWWRLHDITTEQGKAFGLNEQERNELVHSLEKALARHSDIENKDQFDPNFATNAADRLIPYFANSPEDVRRVVKRAAEAFEDASKGASAMLAIAWLEDLIPRYRQAGLLDDATRVERAIRGLAEQARGEMKTVSIPFDIPREDLDQWANRIIGSTLRDALMGIALAGLARKEKAHESVREMMENSPLLSRISMTVMGSDGFTTAKIESVEDDMEGRAMHHAADSFQWKAPFLYFAFNRAREKYGYDLDALVAHLNEAPFFSPSREALLREGLAAWLNQDPVKAIHVLVPQIEAACRDLLVLLGASVMRPDPHTGGFEVLGMGAVINHPNFRAGVPTDIRFHLQTLFCDPRGINLRNHLAHGMAQVGLLQMGMANLVVHSLLLLAVLRMSSKSVADDPASDTNGSTAG